MKLLLRVSLSLLFLAAALCAVSYLLPTKCEVVRTIVVKAAPERVFPYLNNPTEWKNWSAWNRTYDPTMIHMYSGPISGTGAIHTWSGDRIGNGQMVVTQSILPSQLDYQMTREGEENLTKGSFLLAKVNGGTLIIWKQTTPLAANPLARLVGAYRKYKLESELDQGLTGLQQLYVTKSKRTALNRK
jgi:hypothetical protein